MSANLLLILFFKDNLRLSEALRKLASWSVGAPGRWAHTGTSGATVTSVTVASEAELIAEVSLMPEASGSFEDAVSGAGWLCWTLVWLERYSSPDSFGEKFEEKLEYTVGPVLSWLENTSETPLSCEE